jgi:hypothetical protein
VGVDSTYLAMHGFTDDMMHLKVNIINGKAFNGDCEGGFVDFDFGYEVINPS